MGGKKGKPAARVFMTVSTPWAIRNYFQTGVVRRLSEDVGVIVLTTDLLARCLARDGHDSYVEIAVWDSGEEPTPWRLARQLRKKLYMESQRIQTEKIWSRYARRPFYQRASAPFIAAAARLINPGRLLQLARKLDLGLNRSNVFGDRFCGAAPALLFATHADTYFEEAVLRSALSNGVGAALMVLSWDHLSTKVVLGDNYRRVMVWTELQRDEVLANYSWYAPDQVRVVGIPHYDAYFRPSTSSRSTWCARHGLDPAKRTIVFYSMPQSRHQSQHLIVSRLAAAIESGTDLPPDLQILIKCHPFDEPEIYRGVLERHRGVKIFATPVAGDPTTHWVPAADEINAARDCLAFADVTTNIYSTVTIEAALFDKPIVHIAFDAAPLKPGRIPCREYYNFTHFKPIVEMGASTLAYDQEELHGAVRRALENPGERSAQRRALAKRFLGPLDGNSSERLVEELLELLVPHRCGDLVDAVGRAS
jgi:hypothetical protein